MDQPKWRNMQLTAEEARLRDTCALALLSANPDLLRNLQARRGTEDYQKYIDGIVDSAFRIADTVLERRQLDPMRREEAGGCAPPVIT